MKKIICVAAVVLILLSLAGCGTENNNKNNKLNIVCTIFPIYDWTREIAGDKADIIWLLNNGTDMHSFQPTAADMIKIADCDVIIYVGGESDFWIEETLSKHKSKNRTEINLLEILKDNALLEETVDGMEAEEEEEDNFDEHVWLSLKNSQAFAEKIADILSEKDKPNAQKYKENAKNYTEKLKALDKDYEDAVSKADKKTLLFADRFPFRYLTEDYKLSYFAAFPGCSAETEASFKTLTFLSQKTDELSLGYVLVTESSDLKIAKTVISNTKSANQKTAVLNSIQSVDKRKAENGTTYLSIMKENLEVLKKALS